ADRTPQLLALCAFNGAGESRVWNMVMRGRHGVYENNSSNCHTLLRVDGDDLRPVGARLAREGPVHPHPVCCPHVGFRGQAALQRRRETASTCYPTTHPRRRPNASLGTEVALRTPEFVTRFKAQPLFRALA